MGMRVTSEERDIIKAEFLASSEKHINRVKIIIGAYYQSKILLKDKHIIQSVIEIEDNEYLDNLAGSILFMLATSEPGAMPLQSMAGQVVNYITASDQLTMRKYAMFVALELLPALKPYTNFTLSRNGHLMIETMISNAELIYKNISKPLTRPTSQHKKLGSFNWELGYVEALDKLNKVPMLILPIEDIEPNKPTGNMYSDDYKKQAELCKKWIDRQKLGKEFEGEAIYFNWAADYRVRMYPVG